MTITTEPIPQVVGIFTDATKTSQEFKFVDSNNIRFVQGQVETRAGRELLTNEVVDGVCRNVMPFGQLSGVPAIAFGTNSHLEVYQDENILDITPYEPHGGVLTNPFTVASGSDEITVHQSAHGLVADDLIFFDGDYDVGGIPVSGYFHVASVTDANNYKFDGFVPAVSTVASVGGSVAYDYFDDSGALSTNPFSIASGALTVEVSDPNHGLAINDRVAFSGATTFGGENMNGEFTLSGATTNNYEIILPVASTAGGAFGGSTVRKKYYLPVGNIDNQFAFGYSSGVYSGGAYSTISDIQTKDYLRTWSLINYGQDVVASPRDGMIYRWVNGSGDNAVPLQNAPVQNTFVFQTKEGNIVALGTREEVSNTFNPMIARCSDGQDITIWNSDLTNSSREFPLNVGSRLIAGCKTKALNLIWSDTALYTMTATGDDNVYSILEVGENCGLIGPNAFTVLDETVFWIAPNKVFYRYSGGSVEAIDSSVWTYIFKHLASNQFDKIWTETTSQRGEIRWHYPDSRDGQEVSRYITFNTFQNCFDVGLGTVTAGVDGGIYPYPIGIEYNGQIYFTEFGESDNSNPLASFLQFAPINIGDGDTFMTLKSFVIDMKDFVGGAELVVVGTKYPNGAPIYNKTFPINGSMNKVDLRATARYIALRIQSNANPSFWRLGDVILDVIDGGAKK